MAFLSVIDGPLRGQQFHLQGDECVLGRHPNCLIEFDISSVSRRHARITREDNLYYIEDLYSRNFTCVNDEKLQPHDGRRRLSNGDRIRISDIELIFHSSDTPLSSGGVLFVDDEPESSESTVMSKVGVSSNSGSAQLTASPEAKLNAMLEITRSLSRTLMLDEVIPQVFSSLFKIFVQADRAFIALRDADGKLVPRWKLSWHGEAAETIRISRTIVNQVMETQEAILSADAANDGRFNMSESVVSFQIRSMMCAPLIDSEGQSMGVLQIDTVKQNKRFQQEDLEVLIAVATQASIAIDNAQMHERALKQQLVDRDLELAREVQHGFLPSSQPEVPGYEFYDFYQPANQVGGDYFDYLPLTDGRVGVIIADVVGKGVAAALLMAKLSAEARFCLASSTDAGEAMTMLNHRLCGMNLDRFVTAILMILDPVWHLTQVANAGHMPPIHRSANGRVTEPDFALSGLPLGVLETAVYGQATMQLQQADSLTMYTDGFSEAVNSDGQLFGMGKVRAAVAHNSGSPCELGKSLVDEVLRFIGHCEQSDDMCLVSFGRP